MNIFYINDDPIIAGSELADEHIRKMNTESAQMLSTAHWATGSSAPYKEFNRNHPCNLWVVKSRHNYIWLLKHGLSICSEYTRRYKKIHSAQEVLKYLALNRPNLPNVPFSEPPCCMPDEFKIKEDTVGSYRKFYIEDKIKIKNLTWNKLGVKPRWVP